jgi:hypothetical protein
MNDFLVPLLIIAIISVVIGFILGGLFSGLGKQPDKTPAQPAARDLTEVVRLWRDRRRGGLVVEAGGRIYRSASELNPAQQARMAQVFEAWRAWMGLKVEAATEAPTAAPALSPVPAPSPVPVSPSADPVRAPGFRPVDVLARAITSDVKAPVQQKSIAAQIDEVLQEKLEGSPLKQRAIRLMELPGKGVVVMVGLDQYVGVDAVPEAEIRELIHSAVVEWERRVEGE